MGKVFRIRVQIFGYEKQTGLRPREIPYKVVEKHLPITYYLIPTTRFLITNGIF